MKIAFLTPEYPHHRIGASGGIGTSIMNLSRGLHTLGHQVTILVYGQDEDVFFEEKGIFFYKIKNIKWKGFSRYLSQKKIEKQINTLVNQKQIDILEAPDWGMTSFIKTKCPLVVRLHGSDTYFCHLDHRPVKWNNKFHEKRVLKNAHALVSVSQFTGILTNQLFHLKRKFSVIPNCIDSSLFSIHQPNIIEEDTILYFGTLIRKKGMLELPLIFNKVYEKNTNAKLLLIGRDSSDSITGNSSTWQMMQSLFSEKAYHNVTYLGSVNYDEIQSFIQKSTLCVFPSFAEALPVSWIEAMAVGKPIVASNIGWAKEVIEDEVSGFLVHPKDHELFSKRIVTLLEQQELCKKMGDEARIRVELKFDSKVVIEQNIAFYESLL